MKQKLEKLISQFPQIEREILNSSKRFIEAGNNKLYTLDFYALAVNNRALSLTNAYLTLIKSGNYLAALPLIRLQLDNALRFFASTLVSDFNDFVMHFLDGKEIRDYKDFEGKNLTDNHLAKKLDEHFPGTLKLYKNACGFIHLSDNHFYPTISEIKEKTREFGIRVGQFDTYSDEEKVDFTSTMIEVTKLVIIVVEQWTHEKNKLGKIYDERK